MNNINAKDKVGQIVARYPYTAEVLNKYRIDYTFQGDQTLGEAIKTLNSEKEDIVGIVDLAVDEFKLMNPDTIYWENEPIDRILDHIEGKHHTFMNKTMDIISKKLMSIPESENLEELKVFFEKLKAEMITHQDKEERELFPLLREYSGNRTKNLRDKILTYMRATEDEHDEAGRLFKELNRLTDDFTPPGHGSDLLKKVYILMDALEKDTFLHIHMENSILFKMI